jgi:hypothetical protein
VHYPDLTPYEYSKRKEPAALNVGWLDAEHEFSKGKVPNEIVEQLKLFAKKPVNQTRGFHVCQFCQNESVGISAKDKKDFWEWYERMIKAGAASSAEIRVVAKSGRIYAAPILICHYIEVHNYQPPQEFIEAVMESC